MLLRFSRHAAATAERLMRLLPLAELPSHQQPRGNSTALARALRTAKSWRATGMWKAPYCGSGFRQVMVRSLRGRA